MRTMKQQGSFGQEGRAYAKAPLGITLNRILGMRQNACNRFHTALYGHAKSSASLNRNVLMARHRSRSQTAHAECEALRTSVGLRRAGLTDLARAGAADFGVTGTGHLLWLRELCANRAHSLGSRILVAGLLPLPRLRCLFRQGAESLTRMIFRTSAVRAVATIVGFSFSMSQKRTTLRRAHEISQRDRSVFPHVMNVTDFGTRGSLSNGVLPAPASRRCGAPRRI